ncbi:DUF805 domain-containing protein [Chitinibacteraceae bacterium HSL-7]
MEWYLKALKQYADFNGRARRKEYWMFTLFYILAMIPLAALMAVSSTLGSVALVVYILAMVTPSLAVGVRRLHDTNRSGWWFLISFVPAVGGLIFFIFTLMEGDKGENQFGADPKGV